MKTNDIWIVVLWLTVSWLAFSPARADDLVITSFSGAGVVTWTYPTNGVTAYRVEGSEAIESVVWTNDIVDIAPTAAAMSVNVPVAHTQRFFRLVAEVVPFGMVLIPGGTNSGSNPGDSSEFYGTNSYPRTYSLAVSSFYMDRYEVTLAKWDEVRNWGLTNGYTDLSPITPWPDLPKPANHPVQPVIWYDAVKWCNARSQMAGRTPAYYTTSAKTVVYKTGTIDIEDDCVNWRNGYRLPTNTEWEYAARGGVSSKRFPWGGDTISQSQANYNSQGGYYDLSNWAGWNPAGTNGGMPFTSPVGLFEAGKNGYGLYDMAGNVSEWCWDWAPGLEGNARIERGGNWYYGAWHCRVGYRDADSVNTRHSYYYGIMGFRTVLPTGQ